MMMKIAVLSDTHIRPGKTLPERAWAELEAVDLILHAGDMLTAEFYEELQALANVVAVRGNGDFWLPLLPYKRIVVCEDLRVGLAHGHLGCSREAAQESVLTSFADDEVDLIIFGHTHAAYDETLRGVHLFNPGSPTEKRMQKYPSMGMMMVDGSKYEIRHIFFDK